MWLFRKKNHIVIRHGREEDVEISFDLKNSIALIENIKKLIPDIIINLAAMTLV